MSIARSHVSYLADNLSDDRADWARLRSRALRWTEQVSMLCEEMRRVVTTHMKTSEAWVKCGDEVLVNEPNLQLDISRGLSAYAYRQARIYEALAIGCIERWVPLTVKHDIVVQWPVSLAPYAAVPTTAPVKRSRQASARKARPLGGSDDEEVDSDGREGDGEEGGLANVNDELADDELDGFAQVTDVDSDNEL